MYLDDEVFILKKEKCMICFRAGYYPWYLIPWYLPPPPYVFISKLNLILMYVGYIAAIMCQILFSKRTFIAFWPVLSTKWNNMVISVYPKTFIIFALIGSIDATSAKSNRRMARIILKFVKLIPFYLDTITRVLFALNETPHSKDISSYL